MGRREKLLLGLAGALGVYWLWQRSQPGNGFSDWSIPDIGQATEYLNEAASNIIDSASNFMANLTRGERNNNPGNIRKSATVWQGQAPAQSDPAFVVFTDPVSGIRALAKTLLNYQKLYGLNTITQIISRWAPPTENNTGAYISAVADSMGANGNDELNLNDPQTLESLTAAIIQHENGRISYSPSVITQGVDKALA
jgi:hypothetical protein